MTAQLYLPQQPPLVVSASGLSLPDPTTGFARVPEQVPLLLDCAAGLVDVLASGPDFVAYSIFDYEGGLVNTSAMKELSKLTGLAFDVSNDDDVLLGPVLVLTR